MQNKLDEMLAHMAHAHQQVARVLDAEREVNVRMAELMNEMPDLLPHFTDAQGLLDGSGSINAGIVAYLSGLADLQEMMADSISHLVKELAVADEE
ncbi:nucleoside-diphosphate sugar epimerase [Paenibacillus gallinarum]|uniref:Nucleoside-diphosphate sugar epimerase n=1 Tax=Paenibacillus gallinarum TaxID=2762232 RepID=A0ABR8T1U6_9BACL|nr:nucleoside-diphosphate sugar epimerase [Paenibacillus gallinarum]MBD7969730.1 nucleoside-diphosphate sugar epimerase [Paenibacillus gallinarum]